MTDRKPPKIDDAPGIVWRERKNGWVATWQARSDLVAMGFMPQTVRLWDGIEPAPVELAMIAKQCQRYQADMLMFSRDGGYATGEKALTLKDLISEYQTHPASRHRNKRYHTRVNHEGILRSIAQDHGDMLISEIKAKDLIIWHSEWSDNGRKVAIGHSKIGHVKRLFGFGAVVLEDKDCERLCVISKDRHLSFKKTGAREEIITTEQCDAIRKKAHQVGLPSIALAQALQFDLILRQKDVIGEWVPLSEPILSDVVSRLRRSKWSRGLRWEEVDANLIVKHVTSKKTKPLVVDLKLAPAVMEELEHLKRENGGELPTKGPIVICEFTLQPWEASVFRRQWRKIARLCGIPDHVRNMDSRAGGITEGEEAGADMAALRDAATHSNISTTEGYARRRHKKAMAIEVQTIRLAAKNKTRTGDD